jgi:hypothetical protein
MTEFFQTRMGHQFYEGTMVNISQSLERANELKEKELELKERELKLKDKELDLLEMLLLKQIKTIL